MPEISVSLNETVITAAVTNPAATSASIASEPITASLEDGIDINASISSTPVTATLINGGTVAITVTDTPVTVSLVAGFGDVVGPASAVDSNFVAFNTTTGKLIKDSGYSPSSFELADATIIKSGNASWVDLTDGGETDLHSHAASGGDISGTGVVGQVAEFVTDTKTLQAAKLIAPTTHILTLTNAAAATLALNITSGKTLTLTAADDYTLTIPATGTAALLATANVFTVAQKINVNSTTAFFVEQDGVKDNTFIVDTTNGRVGVGVAPSSIFEVKSPGTDQLVMAAVASNSTRYLGFFYEDATNNGTLYLRDSAGANAVKLSSKSGASELSWILNGRFGIGTITPSVKFHVVDASQATFWVTSGTRNIKVDSYSADANYVFASGAALYIGTSDANAIYIYAGNTQKITALNTGNVGIGITTPSVRHHILDTTTTTNAVREVQRIEARVSTTSTGSAAGFGVSQTFYAETATDGTNQQQGLISTSWVDATNATRKAKLSLSAYDTAARLGLEIEASGTEPKIGFYGVTPIARAVLATGAGASVDDVITALQNLGLVKQV